MRTSWFGTLALLAVATAAPSARAQCRGGASVLWSYPADGETGVPLNADLLVVTDGPAWEELPAPPETFALLQAGDLPGVELAAASEFPGHLDLGQLEPNTEYRVRVSAGATDASWSFTTGEATRAEGPRGFLGDVELAPYVSDGEPAGVLVQSGPCWRSVISRTCYDNGAPPLVQLLGGHDAALWVLETFESDEELRTLRYFPGSCQVPPVFFGGFRLTSGERFYRVHAISAGGSLRQSGILTLPDAQPSDGEPFEDDLGGASLESGSGCSVAPGAAAGSGLAPLALVALAGALTARRRRVRGR